MGILSRIFKRASSVTLNDSKAIEAWIQGQEQVFENITPDVALSCATIWSCVRVVAEGIASIPCLTYRRLKPRGKERASDHPLYQILHDAPNEVHTAFEFFEMMQGHLCLRGNAYAEIVPSRGGGVAALIPLHPDRMVVRYIVGTNTLTYEYTTVAGQLIIFRPEQILHVKGLMSDGIKGISPLDALRNPIGVMLNAEEHSARWFQNGSTPGGVLKHPTFLKDDQIKRIKKDWEATHGGTRNAYKTVVLEDGMEWQALGFTNEQSQLIETRKFQTNVICGAFRVPPHKIGDLSRATFSNIEQQSMDLVNDCYMPWAVRWQQAMNKALLLPAEKKEYFMEFLFAGLLRGDFESRNRGYATGRQWGWYSVNDVREMENLNPIPSEQGDIYLEPLNMKPAGQETPAEQPAPLPVAEPDMNKNMPDDGEMNDGNTKGKKSSRNSRAKGASR